MPGNARCECNCNVLTAWLDVTDALTAQAPQSSGTGTYPSDLTNAATMNGGPGSVTPTRKEPKPIIDTKRKQTLLNLLDILAELQKDADGSTSGARRSNHCRKFISYETFV